MDTVLARTFLEVVACDSFAGAAERLFVSQSAVSLRIKSLEEQLGRKVFLRSKTGISLTPAGQRFQRYAQSLLQVWEEAKQQVAVPDGFRDILVVAGEYGLWSRLLIRWLPLLADSMPDIAFRAEVARQDRITRQMVAGTVDISVVYAPQVRPGLNVEELFEETMVLVSTEADTEPMAEGYVFIDWGEEFTAFHSGQYPDFEHPRMTFQLGPVSLNYLLNNGGSAYLPKRLVDPLLKSEKLFLVSEAAQYAQPAHVVWRDQVKPKTIDRALSLLRETVDKSMRNELPPPFWAAT